MHESIVQAIVELAFHGLELLGNPKEPSEPTSDLPKLTSEEVEAVRRVRLRRGISEDAARELVLWARAQSPTAVPRPWTKDQG